MPAVTLIIAFEVPADRDQPFVADWERARRLVAAKDDLGATAVHRALRPDVDFRFVVIARVGSPDRWRALLPDTGLPGGDMPFPAHPGLYETAAERGDVDGAGGVVLIDAFEVPPDADDRFLGGWEAAREALSGKRGFLGTRLHRSLGPADFRFVSVARWSSPLMYAKAVADPGFQETVAALPFASHPGLYQVVRP
jgi:heme-degrading monooxygenase HmoA